MSLFERPILLFSDFCIHSRNFLQILVKHPDLFKAFIRINVDVNPQTKQRPVAFYRIQEELQRKIAKVPTIIVTEKTDQGPQIFVLSDKDAFKWLDYNTRSRENGFTGFNSNEMNSFSDGYSKFGSTDLNDATEQNFKFFQKDNSGRNILEGEVFQVGEIKGPDSFLEPNVSSNASNIQARYNSIESERQQQQSQQNKPNFIPDLQSIPGNSQQKVNSSDFNVRLNNYKQESGQLRGNNQVQQIDFTNPNFGLSAKIGGQSNSYKQKDLDQRLNQLMADRSTL
jgi:hypothetical protein